VKIGDVVVEPVFDGVMNVPATAFKGTTDEVWAPHRQFLDADGRLEFALGGFLVRVPGGRLVLVDAGIGARSGPMMSGSGHFSGGELLTSLAKQRVQPSDITDVVFTHLHFDHVGWASHEGAIVFPNATYRCVVLSSGTARGLLLGDVVHCPVELVDDDWAGLGDVDPELAKRTKNALAREIEGTDTPVTAAHFPGMVFGRLLSANGQRSWVV
jgi:glyoxylase-like metal-dependent hydrolase (beta-lactamase superfamily II)